MDVRTFNKSQMNYSDNTFSQTAEKLGLDYNDLPDVIEVINDETQFMAEFNSATKDGTNTIYTVRNIFNGRKVKLPVAANKFHLVIEG
jgi:hypothetical protein